MAKYICKNNPNHKFSAPTADFWCPLCEKNTGMLELIVEPAKTLQDDGKLDALNNEIESIRKEISGLNVSFKESESRTSENEVQENLLNEIKELKEQLAQVQQKNKTDDIDKQDNNSNINLNTSKVDTASNGNETHRIKEQENIFLSICFDGAWIIIDSTVEVYVNNSVVGHGSLKDGFKIDFYISSNRPIIKLKIKNLISRTQEIMIPNLEFGKKYNVLLAYDRWLTGNFKKIPNSFIELD